MVSGIPGCAPEQPQGPTPFAGTWLPAPPNGPGGDYDLDEPNPVFYRTHRKFAQQAADRGIVVQLSLYDIHGLLDYTHPDDMCPGRFDFSPYNQAHNTTNPPYIPWDHPGNCGSCGPALADDPTDARSGSCKGPNGFVQHASLQANHLAYIRGVAEEVGGMGNVMFEIINEAIAGLDWWNITPRGDTWRLEQAANLRKALPVRILRDAFNDHWDSGSGTSRIIPLAGRVPDRRVGGADTWLPRNVRLVQDKDQVVEGGTTIATDTWIGYATSNGNAGSMSMWGRLPFPEPTS